MTVRFKDFGILCFCETWLSSSYTDQRIEIEGFEIFRLDRETGNILNSSHRLKRGGGLIIYVKKDLSKFTEIVPEISRITENVEQLWIKINKPSVRKQVIAVIYRPPSGNITKSIEELTLSLTNIQESIQGEITLVGDFNINYNLRHTQAFKTLKEFKEPSISNKLLLPLPE